MPPFEDGLLKHHDARIGTLARIKARSFGADSLTLMALRVLVYSQLEGGMKDMASFVIRHINTRPMLFGEIAPYILKWRNPEELERFRAKVTFENVATQSPFAQLLGKPGKVRPINRHQEMNQMNWETLKRVYLGLGLDHTKIAHYASQVADIVQARNEAAHRGAMPNVASSMIEAHLRSDAVVVEGVLTDFGWQLLTYFPEGMHLRK